MCTPNALAWTTGTSPWHALTPFHFRSALRFILHIPLGPSPYICWDCQGPADALASHAVRCTRTGAQARGHYAVCHTLLRIASFSGITGRTEQHLPNNDALRPADIQLAHEGRQLAVDVTVVSHSLDPDSSMSTAELSGPSRANARLGHLDQAVQRKKNKYQSECDRIGWDFVCFAADVYGATHPTARELVGHLVKRLHPEDQPAWAANPATIVWRAISAAVISRAAEQYGHACEHYVTPTMTSEFLDLTNPESQPTLHGNPGAHPSIEPSCPVSARHAEDTPDPSANHVATGPQLPSHRSAPPLARFFSSKYQGPLVSGRVSYEDRLAGPSLEPPVFTHQPYASSFPSSPIQPCHQATSGQLSDTMIMDNPCSPGPRCMHLPSGAVHPLRPPMSQTHVASNAELGLRDPPGPVSLLACERAGARVDLRA